jgi:hypothetical protein
VACAWDLLSSAPSLVSASDVGVCAVSSSASALKAVSSSDPVRVRAVSSLTTASNMARSLVPMLRLGCDDYLVFASDVGVCAVSSSASALKAVSSSVLVRVRAASSSATASEVARSLAPMLRLAVMTIDLVLSPPFYSSLPPSSPTTSRISLAMSNSCSARTFFPSTTTSPLPLPVFLF